MTFSILFWNIWYRNQVESDAKRDHLLNELRHLTDQHQPDLVAFSEVVRPSLDKTAPVINYLRGLGYNYSHCAKMAQLDSYWMSGVALCSKFPVSQKQNIVISKNGYAARVGYPDLDKEVISAQVSLSEDRDVKVIVAHPSATVDSLKEYRKGINNLNQLGHATDYARNTILVGDLNQWRLIPGSLRRKLADVMHSRTGSTLHSTWRYNAHRFTPFRLNLDYVYWSKQSDFNLKDFKVLTSDISDHRPILATFRYTSQVYK